MTVRLQLIGRLSARPARKVAHSWADSTGQVNLRLGRALTAYSPAAPAYEVDHRDVDYGFGAVRAGFVVAGEAARVHEESRDANACPGALFKGTNIPQAP